MQPLLPQYEEVRIRPLNFGPKLTTARGTIPTDRGNVRVDWKRTADSYRLRVTPPVNVTAEVHLPATPANSITAIQPDETAKVVDPLRYENGAAVLRTGSGTHEYRVTTGPASPR